MGWKDWPYWLKGGIISGLIPIIVMSAGIIIKPEEWHFLGFLYFIPAILLLYVLPFFIVGVLIGFIIGKVKNRGKK